MKREVKINEHTCAETESKLKNCKIPGIDGLPQRYINVPRRS